VPATVAVVPDAVLVKVKVADPAPPATRSSSSWVSSIMISMFSSPSLSWVEQGEDKFNAKMLYMPILAMQR
jgi:hypothetical protein